MYKSILERMQEEEKQKAMTEARKETEKFQRKMTNALNKKREFLK